MFCIIVVSGCFFFYCHDFIKTEPNETETVEPNISLTNSNKSFLLSEVLSSLLNRSVIPKPTVLLQRWLLSLLIVDVTVRTILQRTAIRFGNTSAVWF